MTDLAEFLLARIAEDEAAARAAALHGPVWDDGGPGTIQDARTVVASDGKLAHSGRGVAEIEPHTLPHITRWDPARVLAECDSKRLMVAAAQRAAQSDRQSEHLRGIREADNYTLWCLSFPYADHPDYREEWRP